MVAAAEKATAWVQWDVRGTGLTPPRPRRRRAWYGEHGARVDRVGIGADGRLIGRVQGLPPAAQAQRGRDARQGVTSPDPVVRERSMARRHERGAGAEPVRIAADGVPVGRVQRWPAAVHAQSSRDPGQGVAGLYHVPRGRACRRGAGAAMDVAAGDGAARFSVLVRVTSVLLVVRVFARAGRTDPVMPTATRVASRVLRRAPRTRTWSTYAWCYHFPSEGISAGRCWPGRRRGEPVGKERS